MAREELADPLSVRLTLDKDDISIDVTHTHLFMGYKPLIIGITIQPDDKNFSAVNNAAVICLNFHQKTFSVDGLWNGFYTDKNCVARLLLKKIAEKSTGQKVVLFFEGIDGHHAFIHPFHQFINNQRERLRKNDPGNVSLPGTLHDMVRIAYAIPRIISIVTLSNGREMNMFPTDLHGAVSANFYISSLRKGGKATAQIEELKKLVISDIDAREYRFAYSLGKNHMQDMRSPEAFNCSPVKTAQFSIPLPFAVIRYRELKLLMSFDAGIHRIHVYENVHEQKIADGATLAHIHQYCAQWRLHKGFHTKFLLR